MIGQKLWVGVGVGVGDKESKVILNSYVNLLLYYQNNCMTRPLT